MTWVTELRSHSIFCKDASLEYTVELNFIMKSCKGMICSSFSSWMRLAMLAFIFCIISRSSAGISDVVGSSVGAVEGLESDCSKLFVSEAKTAVYSTSDKGDSELISLVIVVTVGVELDRCDAMGVVRSDSLGETEGLLLVVGFVSPCFGNALSFWGVMTVLDITGDFLLFSAVDLAKIVEESGVDTFVDFEIGASNGVVVELDDMIVLERSFRVCGCASFVACVKGMEIGVFPLL